MPLCAFAQFTPRMTFSTEYSNQYGPLIKAHMENLMTKSTAGSFLFYGGQKKFRLGLTVAQQLGANQRLRLGLQNLSQRPTMKFASGDKSDYWVAQLAIGSTYQILLHNKWIEGVQVFGNFAHTRSTTFWSPQVIINGQKFNNQRRIAGGRYYGAGTGVTLTPWPGSQIELDANYDQVRFPTEFQTHNNDTKGFGFSGRIAQQLPWQLNFYVQGADRSTFADYETGLQWTHKMSSGNSIGFGGYGGQIFSRILPERQENIVGIDFVYRFGQGWHETSASQRSLLDWVSRTHAALPAVFAMDDQSLIPVN